MLLMFCKINFKTLGKFECCHAFQMFIFVLLRIIDIFDKIIDCKKKKSA